MCSGSDRELCFSHTLHCGAELGQIPELQPVCQGLHSHPSARSSKAGPWQGFRAISSQSRSYLWASLLWGSFFPALLFSSFTQEDEVHSIAPVAQLSLSTEVMSVGKPGVPRDYSPLELIQDRCQSLTGGWHTPLGDSELGLLAGPSSLSFAPE